MRWAIPVGVSVLTLRRYIVRRIELMGEMEELTWLETHRGEVLEVPKTCFGQMVHACLKTARIVIPGRESLGWSWVIAPKTELISLEVLLKKLFPTDFFHQQVFLGNEKGEREGGGEERFQGPEFLKQGRISTSKPRSVCAKCEKARNS